MPRGICQMAVGSQLPTQLPFKQNVRGKRRLGLRVPRKGPSRVWHVVSEGPNLDTSGLGSSSGTSPAISRVEANTICRMSHLATPSPLHLSPPPPDTCPPISVAARQED